MLTEQEPLLKKLQIDLEKSGWTFVRELNSTANGVVITEQSININHRADFTLVVDDKAIAIIEVKIDNDYETTRRGLEQAKKLASLYASNTIKAWQYPVPFIYLYNGNQILFQDLRDINSRPKSLKNFYTPGDLRKFLPTIPYSSGNVTNNIDIFLKYLKLAIILVNNNDNAIIQEYFKSRYSEDKYYNIGNKQYGIKRILQFAYYLFSEVYLLNPDNDIFNINNKSLKNIMPEDYPSQEFCIEFLDNCSKLMEIKQGERIKKENNQVKIKSAMGFVRDTASYSIPIYEKFSAQKDNLIKFGENNSFSKNNFVNKFIQRFVTDQPTDDDKLNRALDARRITAFLMSEKTQTPINIAIISNWGTGKSSFVKLITKTLKEINQKKDSNTTELSECKKSKIVYFNAWQYNDGEQIGLALLNEIYNQLCWYKKIITSLQTCISNPYVYSSILLLLLAAVLMFFIISSINITEHLDVLRTNFEKIYKISTVLLGSGGLFLVLHTLYKNFNKLSKYIFINKNNNLYQTNINTMHKIKKEISRIYPYLADKNDRLVIIIDDLDRCSRNSIIHLLDALAIYFHEDSDTVVILNIDINIIIDAINTCKFNNKELSCIKAVTYLEKLIQLNYNIPPLNESDAANLINNIVYTPEQNSAFVQNKNITQNIKQTTQNNIQIKKIDDIEIEEIDEAEETPIEIEYELPEDIVNALKEFLANTSKIAFFSPRKIKRIINILRILNNDLYSNSIEFNAKNLVAVLCLLEKYPDITYLISEKIKIDNSSEIKIQDITENSEINLLIKKAKDFDFTINLKLYDYIRKYIFDIGKDLTGEKPSQNNSSLH